MENYNIYKDIACRTGGDIYIGVVGPVRTGKSTFITKFMEQLVIPNISDKLQKQIATDEMPQSADGKTIMTTQPKFVPANAVKVQFKNKASANVRLVDCVGYLVDGAVGHQEEDKPRLVKTPWNDNEIPFESAAEIGTKKVIEEYSTIGIVLTTDGSFTDIPRDKYVQAENRVVNELKALNKPFIIVLNCSNPTADNSIRLASDLEERYQTPVVCVNALELNFDDISSIMEKVLMEFPMTSFDVNLPKWMQALSSDNQIINNVLKQVKKASQNVNKMCDYLLVNDLFNDDENLEPISLRELRLGEGVCEFDIMPKEGLYYSILSQECGENISDDFELMKNYSKIKTALFDAEQNGYGVVLPTLEEMNLEEPVLVKQGGRYGVKLKASAPSLHIMKVDVTTEVAPTVGSEQQGEDLVNFIMTKYEDNPSGIWETNMLGKSLHDLVNEGLTSKLNSIPKDTQGKMRKTLTRIVNENKGGIICILL